MARPQAPDVDEPRSSAGVQILSMWIIVVSNVAVARGPHGLNQLNPTRSHALKQIHVRISD
jgi:hypothetical protein